MLARLPATFGPGAASAARPVAPTDARSWASIDPNRMSIIVRTLASDAFEGRGPGTPGEAKTIAYLAEQFRLLGHMEVIRDGQARLDLSHRRVGGAK